MYRQIYDKRHTDSQTLNVSQIVQQLFLSNPLKPGVKGVEWRCSWSSANRQCSNYIWLINNFIANLVVTYIRGLTAVSQCHWKYSKYIIVKSTYLKCIDTLSPAVRCYTYTYGSFYYFMHNFMVLNSIYWCLYQTTSYEGYVKSLHTCNTLYI